MKPTHPTGSVGNRILVAVFGYFIAMFAGAGWLHLQLGTIPVNSWRDRVLVHALSSVVFAFFAVAATGFLAAIFPAKLSARLTNAVVSTARRAWTFALIIVAIGVALAVWASLAGLKETFGK
jgi:hypothetical protein